MKRKYISIIASIIALAITFMLVALLTSCSYEERESFINEWTIKGYVEGDNILLKPDSTKGTINYFYGFTHDANIIYFDKTGERQYLQYVGLHEIYDTRYE